MKEEKKYYKELDLLRIISCLGVLFYHLGYLIGGFLSVCCFFVLSGYLSYFSLSNQKKFSFQKYYFKRFSHIYLPLLIVVFLTIATTSFFQNIHWFNLKPESSSVLFGYNNYWQLSVNADYFARHVNSPFMHFWYIAILLQFELIFPFVFLGFRWLKKKVHKIVPAIMLLLLILASIGYFYYLSLQDNIMLAYYDTLARVYSLLVGVFVGYIKVEYGDMIFKCSKRIYPKIVFYLYLAIFITLQFLIDSNSIYFAVAMIAVTFISARLIAYGTLDSSYYESVPNKIIQSVAGVSYEIYLFQYPVLFFCQYLNLPNYWKLPIMLVLIVCLSYYLHFSLDFKNKKNYSVRIALCSLLGIFVLLGFYYYITAKDYSNEINQLKKQLSDNQKLLEEKQEDYKKRLKEENDEWDLVLSNLENDEAGLEDYVRNLPIIAVGDSVMLGAVSTLYEKFPNGYFDAQVSRTDYEANRILLGVKYQGFLSDNIVIHLGTNGQCGISCQREILNTCEGRNVFWVTVSNDYDVHVNSGLYDLAATYPNVSIIDWYSASLGHPEYFAADGIHLNSTGMRVYADTIYQGIYQLYYQQYQEKKNAILVEHERVEKSKISFYGNDILLNSIDTLQKDYPNSSFHIQQDYSYDAFLQDLDYEIENQLLNHNVVIAFHSEDEYTKEQYEAIISKLESHEVYILFVNHSPYSFKKENVHVINFYQEAQKHDDYFMIDHIHLSDVGSKALSEKLKESFTQKEESN